jgi:hypothetical protein
MYNATKQLRKHIATKDEHSRNSTMTKKVHKNPPETLKYRMQVAI